MKCMHVGKVDPIVAIESSLSLLIPFSAVGIGSKLKLHLSTRMFPFHCHGTLDLSYGSNFSRLRERLVKNARNAWQKEYFVIFSTFLSTLHYSQ